MLAVLVTDAPWLEGIELNFALASMWSGGLAEAEAGLEQVSEATKNSPSFWMLDAEMLARQEKNSEAEEIVLKLRRAGGGGAARLRLLEELLEGKQPATRARGGN